VAANRVGGAQLAKNNGATAIVMDDGFQNPSLAKDLSILVVDGTRGIGNARVLPAGPLRAPLSAQLDRAHAMLIVGEVTGAAPLAIAARARRLPLFHGTLEPDRAALAALAGLKVLAFAGIGDPEKFFATLAAAGIEAPVRRSFPDHHRYSRKQAADLVNEAEKNRLQLLTTEKDLARMRSDAALTELAARTRALPVSLTVAGIEDFETLLLGVREGAGRRA
jgi:tetraacyldisaccharide 4'-kinase